MQQLAQNDDRVKLIKNNCNVGPYVSKNIGLKNSTGYWVTGHDADDWAHPQRLEFQISENNKLGLVGSLTYMIRMRPDGLFGHIGKITSFSFDGVARKASISGLFKRNIFVDELGFWDSVRFGADSELIARAEKIFDEKVKTIKQIGMICLDLESSLTNHPIHGVHKVHGISPIRAGYRNEWSKWHENVMTKKNAFLPFPQKDRRYQAEKSMVISDFLLEKVLSK